MNKCIWITSDHPIKSFLEENYEIIVIDSPINHTIPSQKEHWDFTLFNTAEKEIFLNQIDKSSPLNIYSETTFCWGEKILKRNHVDAVFSLATNPHKMEVEGSLPNDFNLPQVKSRAGICFSFPRIISTIINEAYFALGESIATQKDIDLAMEFGVNYPQGPFQWTKKIGPQFIVRILDELHTLTKESRYRCHPKLRLENS